MRSSMLTASLTRCSPQPFICRAPCAPLTFDHRLPALRSAGTSVTAQTGPSAADGRVAPRRPYKKHRAPASVAEDTAVQGYLQRALAIDSADARALTQRTTHPTLLQLSSCEAWVTHLLRLAGGDSDAVLAILHHHPHVLDTPFDQPRQDQLQQLLTTALGITPPQLLVMAKRQPSLLYVTHATIAAATEFLVAQHGGDRAAAQQAVVTHPHLLTASQAALQGGLQCLTEQLGVAPADALGQLHKMLRHPIAARLESRGQWLQQQGFTPAQVLSLALRTPSLFSISTDILQRRRMAFTDIYGIPADAVQRMLAAQPAVWYRDLDGQLTRLKLRYWQQELGYSLSDLPLVPIFLSLSLVNSANRHSTVRDILGIELRRHGLSAALIPARGGDASSHFGCRHFAAYVKQHGAANFGGSLQDALQPLAAKLSQAVHRSEWTAALQAAPPLACGQRSSPQHRQLYVALDSIAERDWPLSAQGIKWIAAVAEAKAADGASRATRYARAAADRAAAPKAPRGRSKAAGHALRGGTTDTLQGAALLLADAVAAQPQTQALRVIAPVTPCLPAVSPAVTAAAAADAVAPALATAVTPALGTASSQPAAAPVPRLAGTAAAASPAATPGNAPEMAAASDTVTARPTSRRRATTGSVAAQQAAPLDGQPLHAAAAEAAGQEQAGGAAGQEQAGGTAGGTLSGSASTAKVAPVAPEWWWW